MKKSIIATTLAGLLIGVGAGQANASGYTFTDLSPQGEGFSWATGINNAGQVVGRSSTFGDAGWHATIWNGTTPTDLSSLGGGYREAYGINDSGQVVGYSNFHATIWNGTTPTDLGALGGSYSTALGINNAGQVVGNININSVGSPENFGGSVYHATIWNGSTPTDLGTLGRGSWANGINDSGQVVGSSHYTLGDSATHATIWNGTTPTDLGTLGGSYSEATGINNAGQVVGWSDYDVTAFNYHATIWNGTTPTDLGTLGGGVSWANGINDSGQVVGSSHYTLGDSAGHATIWNGTTLTDLNDFLSVSEVNEGWVLDEANGINDNGWIVGGAHNTITGEQHAFLLTPVPEPETYAMFMAGLGLMGFIARRRKNGQA